MSMEIQTRLSDQLARYLDLASDETKLTAANMAKKNQAVKFQIGGCLR